MDRLNPPDDFLAAAKDETYASSGWPSMAILGLREAWNAQGNGFTAVRNEFEIRGRSGWRRIASFRPGLVAVKDDAFPPFSVPGASAMVYAGARGETAAQMREEALRISMPDEALYAASA
jgi:hypothetical protein